MLDAQRLRELLVYNPETGEFFRNGEACGSVKGHRYVRVWLDQKLHYGHRLAYLYMTGEWPEYGVDHEDGDGLNNKWLNLRPASQKQNLQNLRTSKGPTSDRLGVSWHRAAGKWTSNITTNGKRVYLGLFDDEENAYQAYLSAKRQMHEFCTI